MKNNKVLQIFSNIILPKGILFEKAVISLSLTLLFIISFSYFSWIGKGIFSYQENRSLFIFSTEYFRKFSVKPGGLLEYAGNFLAQGYYCQLYGSLMISFLLILLYNVFIKINRQISADGSISFFPILLPSGFLLLAQGCYEHFMHYNLGFLLVAYYFLSSITLEKHRLRIITLVIIPVFYYLVGSFIFVYLGMSIIYFVWFKKGIFKFLVTFFLIGFISIVLIISKEILFLQPVDHLLSYPINFFDFSSKSIFILLLSGSIVLFPLFIKISDRIRKKIKFPEFIPLFQILAVFSITVFLLIFNNDRQLSNLVYLENFVRRQAWDNIIKHNEKNPPTDLIEQYYYNLALSNKGELCERLLFVPRNFGAKSLTLPRNDKYLNKSVYFYYTIGLISEAHHLAYESMVRNGYNPENTKMLVKTNLINGHYFIAERYIKLLKKTLHYRSFAKRYEKMVFNPSLINSDPELSEKINLLPKKDFFIRTDDVQNIELFLLANPNNKKAFEYKMARLLLENDIETSIFEIKKMKEMGYKSMPRYIEEAVVKYINENKEFPELGGLTINPETESRFRDYNNAISYNNKNRLLGEKKIKNFWGNTLWYYLQFN